MGIISKEKKEIRWCGLPSKQESMREDARRRRDRAAVDVRRKRRHLQELLTQHASLQNLAKLNKRRGLEAKNSKDLMDEDGGDAEANATLALPFIVVAGPFWRADVRTIAEAQAQRPIDIAAGHLGTAFQMRVKRRQYLFCAGAIFRLAGDENLIAAIGERDIKRLLNARQMLAMLAIKLGQKSIIVELKNKRFADKALMFGEIFVRTAQARAPIFLRSSKTPFL